MLEVERVRDNMRTMILSFSEEWYPPLICGEKIYEHRKRFCNEPVKAYIYLGLPRRQIVAIVELGQREHLEEWLERYKEDIDAVKRINDYLTRNKYAMPVLSVQEIEPIDIRAMETEVKGFRVPISYMFIDDKPLIYEYIKDRTTMVGAKIVHDFTNITSRDVCLC